MVWHEHHTDKSNLFHHKLLGQMSVVSVRARILLAMNSRSFVTKLLTVADGVQNKQSN